MPNLIKYIEQFKLNKCWVLNSCGIVNLYINEIPDDLNILLIKRDKQIITCINLPLDLRKIIIKYFGHYFGYSPTSSKKICEKIIRLMIFEMELDMINTIQTYNIDQNIDVSTHQIISEMQFIYKK